jgi:hypothetical protein
VLHHDARASALRMSDGCSVPVPACEVTACKSSTEMCVAPASCIWHTGAVLPPLSAPAFGRKVDDIDLLALLVWQARIVFWGGAFGFFT